MVNGWHTIVAVDANKIEIVGVDNDAGVGTTCNILARAHFVIDGQYIEKNPTAYENNSIEYGSTLQAHALGADNDNSEPLMSGCLVPFAFNPAFLDLGDPIVCANIWDKDGTLKDPGPDGINWYPSQPLLLFQDPAQRFETNSGSDAVAWSAPTT